MPSLNNTQAENKFSWRSTLPNKVFLAPAEAGKVEKVLIKTYGYGLYLAFSDFHFIVRTTVPKTLLSSLFSNYKLLLKLNTA